MHVLLIAREHFIKIEKARTGVHSLTIIFEVVSVDTR